MESRKWGAEYETVHQSPIKTDRFTATTSDLWRPPNGSIIKAVWKLNESEGRACTFILIHFKKSREWTRWKDLSSWVSLTKASLHNLLLRHNLVSLQLKTVGLVSGQETQVITEGVCVSDQEVYRRNVGQKVSRVMNPHLLRCQEWKWWSSISRPRWSGKVFAPSELKLHVFVLLNKNKQTKKWRKASVIHFILQTVISFHVSSDFSYWRKSNKYVIRSGILFENCPHILIQSVYGNDVYKNCIYSSILWLHSTLQGSSVLMDRQSVYFLLYF